MITIKSFCKQYIDKETRIVYGLIILSMLVGFLYMAINAVTTRYTGFDYVPLRWVILAPLVLLVMVFALLVRHHAPRSAKFTQAYGTLFFLVFSCAVLTTGVQLTPFPTIDAFLVRVDRALGVDTPALIVWTVQHPHFYHLLEHAYSFLYIEIITVPLILPFFKGRKTVNHFFITMILLFLIATTIYYFFPTAAPAAVFHSQYFMDDQHATAAKFFKIHHHQVVTSGDGGLIAFPSCHVAWATILTAATWRKKWIFIPLAAINVFLIAATVLLGFHYLVDVFAGFAVAALAMTLSNWIVAKHLAAKVATSV